MPPEDLGWTPPAGGRDPAGATGPPAQEVPAGIRTFLIADIRGYTRYTHEHGDEAAASLASRFAVTVETIVTTHHGDLLELRGDEALVVFASARHAIRAAVALQQAFTGGAPPNTQAVPVGIGIDVGEAVSVRGGFRGAALNMAARLCSVAVAGQVLATPEVVHLATRMDGVRFGSRGIVRLKGLEHPVQVVTVEADSADVPPRRPSPLVGLPRLVQRRPQRPARSRRRVSLVALLGGAMLVLTALAWGPWLPPPEESSSTDAGGSAATPALEAVLLFNDEFPPPGNRIGHAYMFAATGDIRPRDYPDAGIRSGPRLPYWEGKHGGVPVMFQTVRLELAGLTNEPIPVTGIVPRVLERKPPLAGWYVVPEMGSGAPVRYVETNLDCAEPRAVVVGGNKPAQQEPITALDLQVSRLDKEAVEITAYSSRSYIRWGLDITYVLDGEARTLEIRNPRLQVTAANPGIRAFVAPLQTGELVREPSADPTQRDMAFMARSTARLCSP